MSKIIEKVHILTWLSYILYNNISNSVRTRHFFLHTQRHIQAQDVIAEGRTQAEGHTQADGSTQAGVYSSEEKARRRQAFDEL